LLSLVSGTSAQDAKPDAGIWKTLKFSYEFRTRYEARTGVSFGRSPDLEYPLFRNRLGVEWKPATWVQLHALAQDARAPLYGSPAPGSARDTLDLQEAYAEFLPGQKNGFNAILGREMLQYGESRLIGAPQWLNTARTYDTLRLQHITPRRTLRAVFLSVIQVRPDDFNKPQLGNRIWGTYNTINFKGGEWELYALRHDQNQTAGFRGEGRLGVNLFGTRLSAPLGKGVRLGIETIGETGRVGLKTHRAGAWYSGLFRTWNLGKPIEFSVEYKYASGTKEPTGDRSGTFDQLYPANHDKFGHADLFGWRNIHNVRSLETITMTKNLKVLLMYDSSWLASPKDALYSGPGQPIAIAPNGDAGTHVGQEVDAFFTYRWRHMQFGGGVAKLFTGEFLHNTSPSANSFFWYAFQTITF
jgi:hypothetical protein